MTDWSQLDHAYGAATDVPGLLHRADPDAADSVWQDLWSRLCHQGSVYTASYAAIPALAEKTHQWSAPQRFNPLMLAASIIASTDSPWPAELARASLAEEIELLTTAARESLRHPGLATDPTTYIYLLQALLGLEGVDVWGEHLEKINDEEYEVPCPGCGTENFVVFGGYGHFTTLEGMYMCHPDAHREPLQPAPPAALQGLADRLHAQALADGQPHVADQLTYVFGRATCADCGSVFSVDEAITELWS